MHPPMIDYTSNYYIMLAIDYTERLIDGFTVASGTLETDFMDILISSKRLTGKI